MILDTQPAAAECKKVFAKGADCCIQYDEKRLAKRCEKMSSKEFALICFTEIHEVGFWKTDLTGENEPGLADQYVKQWKKNVMQECMKESSKADALACAVLQKSGTKFVRAEEQRVSAVKQSSMIPSCSAAAKPLVTTGKASSSVLFCI